jgi:hypothetical protein
MPPDPDGVATCANGHTWPASWTGDPGSRTVIPDTCTEPGCSAVDWVAIMPIQEGGPGDWEQRNYNPNWG